MKRLPLPLLGALIGAVFGLVFVLVNAHAPLDPALGIALRVLAGLMLAAFLLIGVLTGRRAEEHGGEGPPLPTNMFGTRYRWVVLGEAVLMFGGVQVLRLLDVPEQGNVAWIAFVVGVHFLVLAWVWSQPSVLVPGVGLTVLGIIGLVMTSSDTAVEWTPFVSGVLSGITLLAGSLGFTLRNYLALNRDTAASPAQ